MSLKSRQTTLVPRPLAARTAAQTLEIIPPKGWLSANHSLPSERAKRQADPSPSVTTKDTPARVRPMTNRTWLFFVLEKNGKNKVVFWFGDSQTELPHSTTTQMGEGAASQPASQLATRWRQPTRRCDLQNASIYEPTRPIATSSTGGTYTPGGWLN